LSYFFWKAAPSHVDAVIYLAVLLATVTENSIPQAPPQQRRVPLRVFKMINALLIVAYIKTINLITLILTLYAGGQLWG